MPRSGPDHSSFLGIWTEPPYYYLFFSEPVDNVVERWLQAEAEWVLCNTYSMAYDEWQGFIGDQLEVGPFTVLFDSPGSAPVASSKNIFLSRCLAFGSGFHPTTQGCLLALAQLAETRSFDRVIDVGTGTGILAIAAARLGADKVFAFDCNLLAAMEADRNVKINGLHGKIHVFVGDDLHAVKERADLLIMNLEWPCLQMVLADDAWFRFPLVIISGFTKSQWHECRCYLVGNADVLLETVVDEWITITCVPY